MKEEMTTTPKDDLNVLLQLYFCIQNKLEFRLKRSEEPPTLSITVLAILAGTQFFSDSICSSNKLLNGKPNYLVLAIIYLYPIIVNISMQKASEEHKFIAILRGYSASLEKRINTLINKEIFIYNSELYDKYIEKITSKKKSSVCMASLSTYVAGLAPLVICIGLLIYNVLIYKYSQVTIIILIIIGIILFPVYFALIITSSKSIANTTAIKKEVECICNNKKQ